MFRLELTAVQRNNANQRVRAGARQFRQTGNCTQLCIAKHMALTPSVTTIILRAQQKIPVLNFISAPKYPDNLIVVHLSTTARSTTTIFFFGVWKSSPRRFIWRSAYNFVQVAGTHFATVDEHAVVTRGGTVSNYEIHSRIHGARARSGRVCCPSTNLTLLTAAAAAAAAAECSLLAVLGQCSKRVASASSESARLSATAGLPAASPKWQQLQLAPPRPVNRVSGQIEIWRFLWYAAC